MPTNNIEFVNEFCHSLVRGSMARAREMLHPEVFYHNKPWEPMTGADAVCDFLQPFIDGTHCALKEMKILHQAGDANIVMNAREETWVRRDISVLLPVAGLFVIENELITRWIDYWDLAVFKPILDDLEQ